jgi:hypothetical protein
MLAAFLLNGDVQDDEVSFALNATCGAVLVRLWMGRLSKH